MRCTSGSGSEQASATHEDDGVYPYPPQHDIHARRGERPGFRFDDDRLPESCRHAGMNRHVGGLVAEWAATMDDIDDWNPGVACPVEGLRRPLDDPWWL